MNNQPYTVVTDVPRHLHQLHLYDLTDPTIQFEVSIVAQVLRYLIKVFLFQLKIQSENCNEIIKIRHQTIC